MNELFLRPENEIIPQQPLDRNPAAVYLAGLAPSGRRAQAQALRVVAELLFPGSSVNFLSVPWPELRYQHAVAIRSQLVERYKPASVNRMLCAVRGVLKAAWRLGELNGEDYRRAADVASVTGSTLPTGRELTPGELSALMADCENDPSPAGARDAALIALMYSCGLRRNEVAGLELENYDPETGHLVVLGKRSKERAVWLTNGALEAMTDWLVVRGQETGALFVAINKGGRLRAGHMANQAIYNALAKRGESAGVKAFTPHDMRRTFVSDLLEAGADIATVAKMAGHASVNTTARYDRRPEETKRKTAQLLHVPYHGRKNKHQ